MSSFTQDLFTQRRNYEDGNVRIGQLDRIWYDEHRNAFYIGDGVTLGGKLIGGGGGAGGEALSDCAIERLNDLKSHNR